MAKTIYWSLLLVLAVTGAAMVYCSLSYQWHIVPDNALSELSVRLESKPLEERSREWYVERRKLETPRKMLSDTGTGLIALASILGLLRLSTGFPLRDSHTPKRRWQFIAIYLFALAIQVPDSFWYFRHRLTRFDYPAWGDTIFIGIFQTFMGCVIFAVIGCLFWWPFLVKSRFPATLFTWPSHQPWFNTIVTICTGGLTLICLDASIDEARDGNIGGVWIAVVMIYLFLSLRAGLATHRFENKKEKSEIEQVSQE